MTVGHKKNKLLYFHVFFFNPKWYHQVLSSTQKHTLTPSCELMHTHIRTCPFHWKLIHSLDSGLLLTRKEIWKHYLCCQASVCFSRCVLGSKSSQACQQGSESEGFWLRVSRDSADYLRKPRAVLGHQRHLRHREAKRNKKAKKRFIWSDNKQM